MNSASEVIPQSKRASNPSCAVTGEDKLTSALTNEMNANESESAGNDSSETNGINESVNKSENLSEQNSITKDENNQRTAELQQEKIPPEENLKHNPNNTSTELNISNEIHVAVTENDNIAIDDEERQKNVGCCGCFVEVCYCITWYWRIMTNSLVSFFRSCGNSLRNLCRSCGRSPNDVDYDSDGKYFYSDLKTFNTEIDDGDRIIEVQEAPTVLTNNCSVADGNDGGYDNCGVDGGHYDNCNVNEGGFPNSNVEGGGCDNNGADGGTDSAHCCDS